MLWETRVKLANSQPTNVKHAAKNKAGTTLRMAKKNV